MKYIGMSLDINHGTIYWFETKEGYIAMTHDKKIVFKSLVHPQELVMFIPST